MKTADSVKNGYRRKIFLAVKRAFDLLAAFTGSILSIPIVLIACLAIMAEEPTASPFFIQERVGKDGKHFFIYKLRSMHKNAEERLPELGELNEAEGPAFKMKNDPRITKVGKVLRKTYIDELPQLWNVVKGDMSLVGPRPPLPREVEQYTDYQMQRLSVQQGMTCYWQIAENRYTFSFDKWVELDLKYVREQSFRTDLTILLSTIKTVLRAGGW